MMLMRATQHPEYIFEIKLDLIRHASYWWMTHDF